MELTNRAVRSDILAVEKHPQAVLCYYILTPHAVVAAMMSTGVFLVS